MSPAGYVPGHPCVLDRDFSRTPPPPITVPVGTSAAAFLWGCWVGMGLAWCPMAQLPLSHLTLCLALIGGVFGASQAQASPGPVEHSLSSRRVHSVFREGVSCPSWRLVLGGGVGANSPGEIAVCISHSQNRGQYELHKRPFPFQSLFLERHSSLRAALSLRFGNSPHPQLAQGPPQAQGPI